MSLDGLIEKFEQTLAFGGSAGAVLFALRWLATFVAGRVDRRQAAVDAEHAQLDQGWERYRHNLEQRVQTAEAKLQTYDEKFKQAGVAMAELEGLLAAERHRSNNTRTLFEALLWLLERSPEKAGEHLAHIKELRTALVAAEAAEKGALRGAMAATAGAEPATDTMEEAAA